MKIVIRTFNKCKRSLPVAMVHLLKLVANLSKAMIHLKNGEETAINFF